MIAPNDYLFKLFAEVLATTSQLVFDPPNPVLAPTVEVRLPRAADAKARNAPKTRPEHGVNVFSAAEPTSRGRGASG